MVLVPTSSSQIYSTLFSLILFQHPSGFTLSLPNPVCYKSIEKNGVLYIMHVEYNYDPLELVSYYYIYSMKDKVNNSVWMECIQLRFNPERMALDFWL